MRVSHIELYTHCKKIFQACGVPYGYAEEGAETVANAEFLGLYGLQQLSDELPNLQSQLEELKIVSETAQLTVINGGKQSGMLLGKACADYVIARLQNQQSTAVCIKQTTPSRVLAQQAMYMSKKGLGSIILYKLRGHSSLIIASPSMEFPVMIHKRNNADIVEIINKQLRLTGDKALVLPETFTDFFMFGTKSIEAIDQLIEQFEQTIDPSCIITTTEDFEQKWISSWENGAEINKELWMDLNETGKRMLVESTDQSRSHGAG
ncbi:MULTISPECIES: DUF3726 domain-containing protein [Planococcus]|uniref:DUF3726 domain-containing protein n=2 Tax=Planococcus TaxID=1372 RepID=A0ABM5WZK1_9BACL|nr:MULTISPECIES: DUF3726 domain-containing protein [Planococcus]ALS79701.1 hypothetical protein AUO94_14180 [Planococcus kocurii]AQU78327.1 hypothetical protein AJGP001_03005 [Planococcus faecalis]KAA0955337.1 DUF3726 domain-containing protein [Planococcus sp. ANT_H30]MDJ0331873.1 DUF3726 domain-containing protein [Planococcus sp. S3-L1]OHX51287.1 hypothetical protein BB777_17225 [Planococcus faecalis]